MLKLLPYDDVIIAAFQAARTELESVKNLASRPGEEGIEAQIKVEVLEAIAQAADSK